MRSKAIPQHGASWKVKPRGVVLLVGDNDAGRVLIEALLKLAGPRADDEVPLGEFFERLRLRRDTLAATDAANG